MAWVSESCLIVSRFIRGSHPLGSSEQFHPSGVTVYGSGEDWLV